MLYALALADQEYLEPPPCTLKKYIYLVRR